MTSQPDKTILVLATGLFADAATINEALATLEACGRIVRRDVTPDTMNEAAWDRLLGDILGTDLIITL